MPRLIISKRGKKEEQAHNCQEDEILIGRQEDCTIVLAHKSVSRHHAKIIRQDENFFIVDLGSDNGTQLNGTPLEANEKQLLRNNDLVSIDIYNLRYLTADEALEKSYNEEVTDSDILEVKLLKKVLKALDTETVPSFEVLNGSAEGKKVYLTDEVNELLLGRDPNTDFVINEFAISRKHVRITKRWGGIVVRDLESKNGTFVNNRRVVEEFLHDGDRIALGTIVLLFRNPQEMNLAQLQAQIPPKQKPAPVDPTELAAAEESESEEPLPEEINEEMPPTPTATPAKKIIYPTRRPKQSLLDRLTIVEVGMIGLGALVLIFALVTFVNLMFQ
ncbi:MAG: FHA domain-containing protein [Pseudomonadota bacterium]